MPIMRKMNLINVHFWTYLKSVDDHSIVYYAVQGGSNF